LVSLRFAVLPNTHGQRTAEFTKSIETARAVLNSAPRARD